MDRKRFIALGIFVAFLVIIPVTLWAVTSGSKTTQQVTKATPATTLSFSTLSAPVATGQQFSLDIIMNPGSNQVSFVKLYITYDNTKLAKAGSGLVPNSTAFPTTLEGPVYNQCSGTLCTISVTLSVGADPSKVVTQTTTVATMNFQALASTADTTTQVAFGTQTQVLSIAKTDSESENVLSTTTPASITIVDASTLTGSPTPTAEATATPEPTSGSGGNGANNQLPVCSSLTVDQATGSAPLTSNFTAAGSDSDGTISKVTYNFGDGNVQDVTSGGGIGTNTVNNQIAHTYVGGGTFTATAVMTDDMGAVSNAAACTQVIAVSGAPATPSATTQPTATEAQPTAIANNPTIPPTGPGMTILAVGAVGVVLSIIGGLLFFGL